MAGIQIQVQHKIITGVGIKPTIPSPSYITPDDSAWNNNTDILIGQLCYNETDNIWYTRNSSNVIKTVNSVSQNDYVRVVLVEGENEVEFPESLLPGTNYEIFKNSFDNAGDVITSISPSLKTESGFTIYASADCILLYKTITY